VSFGKVIVSQAQPGLKVLPFGDHL